MDDDNGHGHDNLGTTLTTMADPENGRARTYLQPTHTCQSSERPALR